MVADPDLDLVVFGASGFTGRLVVQHLARSSPAGTRIGLAGRSADRLGAVRDELGESAAAWPLVVVDAADDAALASLAARTRVVATTVGPYARYGLPLVRACARAGTDYADLSAEVSFIRRSIDTAAATAERTGARIVHACGFDSVPSDLAVLLLHEAAAAGGAGELTDTTLGVVSMRGGFSGGTVLSALGQLDEARRDPAIRALLTDPYSLSPDRAAEPDLGRQPDDIGVHREPTFGGWVGPWMMAGANTRVVRRSNALQGWGYGREFRYRELVRFGDAPLAPVAAWAVTGGLSAATRALGFGPAQAALGRLLPTAGTGPGERTRRAGSFRIQVQTRTSGGQEYVATVAATGDPGYTATSVMMGESALALALDRDRLPDRAGVLTPATGIGRRLVDRLRAAGMTWTVQAR